MVSTRTGNGGKTGHAQSAQVKALLELGKKAVASMREGSLESLDVLEEYVNSFALWESSWSQGKNKLREIPAKDRELARRVANQHTQILRLAAGLRAEMDESLKSLRVKGRGLKAYIDHLPQRVSTIKARKG
jgi:hypothetical protein